MSVFYPKDSRIESKIKNSPNEGKETKYISIARLFLKPDSFFFFISKIETSDLTYFKSI